MKDIITRLLSDKGETVPLFRDAAAEIDRLRRELVALNELAYTDPRTHQRSWKDAHKDAHEGNVVLTTQFEQLQTRLTSAEHAWLRVRDTFEAYLVAEVQAHGGIPRQSPELIAFQEAVAVALDACVPNRHAHQG